MSFKAFYNLFLEKAAKRSYACLMGDCAELNGYMTDIQNQIDPEDVWEEEEGHGLEDEFHITVLYRITTRPSILLCFVQNYYEQFHITVFCIELLWAVIAYFCVADVVDQRSVKSSNGQTEDRIVIETLLQIGSFPLDFLHAMLATVVAKLWVFN